MAHLHPEDLESIFGSVATKDYKTVDLEYVRSDTTERSSTKRIRFRINGVDEWLEIDKTKKNFAGWDDVAYNDADESLIQELEHLLNKILAR